MIKFLILLLSVLNLCFMPTTVDAVEMVSGYISAEAEDISYKGNDRYEMMVSILNKSNKIISIKEVEYRLYIQTEVIGRWVKLENQLIKDTFEIRKNILPSGEKWTMVSIVHIPLNIPRLYINFEGDVNVMLEYKIEFTLKDRGEVFTASGSSSYWITPKTNRWFLRQGM